MRCLHMDLSPLVSLLVSGLLHSVVLGTIVVASWQTRTPPISHLVVVLVEGSSGAGFSPSTRGEEGGGVKSSPAGEEGEAERLDLWRAGHAAEDPEPIREESLEQDPPREKPGGDTVAETPIREGEKGPLGQRGEVFTASVERQGLLNESGGGGSGGVGRSQGTSTLAQGSSLLALLHEKITRATLYPPRARREGIEGTVELHFTVSSNGRVGRVEVLSSSGSSLLDRAAIETLYRAEPLPVAADWIRILITFQLTR